jgi:hypothetical protein
MREEIPSNAQQIGIGIASTPLSAGATAIGALWEVVCGMAISG